jgi:hypothetical protein
MTVRMEDIASALAGRPGLLRDASARALAYLDGLADRPVAPAAADVAALGRLDFALPGPGMHSAATGWPPWWTGPARSPAGSPMECRRRATRWPTTSC